MERKLRLAGFRRVADFLQALSYLTHSQAFQKKLYPLTCGQAANIRQSQGLTPLCQQDKGGYPTYNTQVSNYLCK